jgi:NADH-quinone oxidoreductase subunit H
MFNTILISSVVSLLLIISLLISIAFLTLIERKLIGATQNRKGPNSVGPLGILQPFADALKLLAKEAIFPRNAKLVVFILSPLISLFFALLA